MKNKLIFGLIFGIIVTSTIIPLYGQEREYTYNITWEPGELTRWGGHLWTIRTTTFFSGRDIVESSIKVDVNWQYVEGEFDEKKVTPIFILGTRDAIYMLFSYDDFVPYGAYPPSITATITGDLENGETFYAEGPGPGFMRRP